MTTRYHQDGTLPPDPANWVWVFGSNMQGSHGAGAARVARLVFGAQLGVPFGPIGRAYAIPTVVVPGCPRALRDIAESVRAFLVYARVRPDLQFWVTAVGCGLAGYQHQKIAPMFESAPNNCSLPEPWHVCARHAVPEPDRDRVLCSVCWSVLRSNGI